MASVNIFALFFFADYDSINKAKSKIKKLKNFLF